MRTPGTCITDSPNIGFSQRRAVLYLWGWCAILAGAALATRFLPMRAHGQWNLWPTLVAAGIGVVAVAASAYIVLLLEILKLRRVREWGIWRREGRAPPGAQDRVTAAESQSPPQIGEFQRWLRAFSLSRSRGCW